METTTTLSKSKTTNILNLVIIGLAIIAIILFRKNFKDSFVDLGPLGSQPLPPTLSWYGNGFQGQGPSYAGSGYNGQYYQNAFQQNLPNLGSQPLVFQKQMYPKTPYVPNVGLKCNGDTCGAAGNCYQGYCRPNDNIDKETVFNQQYR